MNQRTTAWQRQEMLAVLPVAEPLTLHLQQTGSLRDVAVAWHCHLTELTAIFAQVLVQAGVRLYMSEADPLTTSADAVSYMQDLGIQIFLGPDSPARALSHKPQLLADTGLVLISAYHAGCGTGALAGSEITTSGITRLRTLNSPALPVVNLNDGVLKPAIENFHGVGSGVVEALARLGHPDLSDLDIAVIGYGRVGAGAAHYLGRAGARVSIVESDPKRRLIAHFDGYAGSDLEAALNNSTVVITATGKAGLISQDQFVHLRNHQLLVNIGHWGDEIDLPALTRSAIESKNLDEHRRQFTLTTGKVVTVACQGSPANVALLTGRPEPTLIHLTTEALTMSYLATAGKSAKLAAGEHLLPPEVEDQTSRLVLEALQCRLR